MSDVHRHAGAPAIVAGPAMRFVPEAIPQLAGAHPEPVVTPVLFLDLDDTVRWGRTTLGRFVNGPDDVTVFPEAITMMARWKARGGRCVAVSNQGGVGLGLVDPAAMIAAMHETHRQTGELFDLLTWCPHAPAARYWCRKPAPGMLYAAMARLASAHNEISPREDALMVGDRPEDQECANAARVRFMHAEQWRAAAHQPGGTSDA